MFSLKSGMAFACLALSVVLLGSASAAQAIVAESHITSPTDPAYLFDETAASPKFNVSGTANVSEVEIRCYYAAEGFAEVGEAKKEAVKVTGGSFSVSEPVAKLPPQPCVLRAVPKGETGSHAPGASDRFEGPRVLESIFGLSPSVGGVVPDYDFEADSFDAYLGIGSVGNEGLYYSFLFAPVTLRKSESGFYDNASLSEENHPASGSATRSEIQVDGENAYSPNGALAIAEELVGKSKVLPGTPSVAAEQSYTPMTGEGTLRETDPIVRCAPEPSVYPPTISSCTSFVSTGVQLQRVWRATHGDRVALMTDSWTSTDKGSHALDALYNQEVSENGEGAFEFPGTSSFAAVAKEQSVSLPGGSGAIYYKVHAATPDGGDLENPQLAIVYDSSPEGAIGFHTGSVKSRPDFEMHYARTIPAGGAATLRMGFVTEYALNETKALAGEILASYPPSVAISSPASGGVVHTPNVTVTGSASDTGALSSVAVNGHAAALAADGTWSVSVPVAAGANALTAVATDQAGLTSSKSVTVTYAPTPPAVPLPSARQAGIVSAKNGRVSFKLACKGIAGQKCKVMATLTTVEKLRGPKLVAVIAKHGPKVRFKTVTVGFAVVVVPAGETVGVTIGLNATGRRLLARYHKLPVHLSAVLVTSKTQSTVIAQNLVVQPRRPKAKSKRHRH